VKQVIAKVKLNPGNGGYFDPVTRIHLTHGSPIGNVYAGMNVTGLQAAVRSRRISVVEGSLGKFEAPFKLVKANDGKVVLAVNKPEENTGKQEKAPEPKKVEKKETKAEEPKVTPVVEEPKAAPIVEESVEQKEEPAEAKEVEETVDTVESADEKSSDNTEEKPKKRGKKKAK